MNTLIDLAREFLFTREKYKKLRLGYLARRGLAYLFYIPMTWHYRRCMRDRAFTFAGKTYRYFCHLYNATWRNDRAIEVPIIRDLLWQWRGMRILEVGNVMGHYFKGRHDVLDKYERADGIINEDAVSFSPLRKYDLVISVSTLEHIGWDENPKHPEKLLKALDNLRRNVLQPRGKMLVTLPLGYNSYMDGLLAKGKLPLDGIRCMERESHRSQEWREVPWDPKRVKEAECREGYGTTVVVFATLRSV